MPGGTRPSRSRGLLVGDDAQHEEAAGNGSRQPSAIINDLRRKMKRRRTSVSVSAQAKALRRTRRRPHSRTVFEALALTARVRLANIVLQRLVHNRPRNGLRSCGRGALPNVAASLQDDRRRHGEGTKPRASVHPRSRTSSVAGAR